MFLRKNLCCHPAVSQERDGKLVDARCHALTAPHVRERALEDTGVEVCSYYEAFDRGGRELLVPAGVYNLDDVSTDDQLVPTDRLSDTLAPWFLQRQHVYIAEKSSNITGEVR